jgi:hypothetical protein
MEDNAKSSSEFLTAIYEVDGPESRARATADRIGFDKRAKPRKTFCRRRGRIGPERLAELSASLCRDTIFVLGSRLQKKPGGILSLMQAFHRVLVKSFT